MLCPHMSSELINILRGNSLEGVSLRFRSVTAGSLIVWRYFAYCSQNLGSRDGKSLINNLGAVSERQRRACPLDSPVWGGVQHTEGGMLVGWVGWTGAEAKQASQPGPHPGNIASRGQAFLELALLFSLTLAILDRPFCGSWHVTLSHFWVLALGVFSV